MIADLMDVLFGCVHSRYSWPRGKGAECYVACLSCGREFYYDLNAMSIQSPKTKRYDSQPDQYQGNLIGELTEQVEGATKV